MKFKDYFPTETENFKINHFSPDALADLPYEKELELKNYAIKKMLSDNGIKENIFPVIASPLPRKYRTTTKRRIFFDKKQIYLHFGKKHTQEKVAFSNLEPDTHIQIYNFLQKIFSQPRNFKVSSVLNYFIIRGSYTEHALIINLRQLSGDIIRILKAVSSSITEKIPSIKSIFIYVDPSASDYYLEAERPDKGINFKKIYGSDFLALKLDGKKFLYSPLSFSQINESILPVFFDEFKKYLTPQPDDILLDLYCGYGLWSLAAGDLFKSVRGIELSAESVKSAAKNAAFHYPGKNFRYETGFINTDCLRSKLPPSQGKNEWILLDPPRKGCENGVAELLIARKAHTIFQLFCGADEIAPALQIYQANNCRIQALLPFDFFPGSINIEMLAVITC